MKLLIVDHKGMVGHVVYNYFTEHGHSVDGIEKELYIISSLSYLIEKVRYDAIINCAAIVNQDAETDKAAASYINAFLPHFLEKLTEKSETVVVHRSTDCIFSGKKGSYTTSDVPDADSFYARTKAIGEIINDKDITIRTSLIGPEYVKDGTGLFNWFFNQKGRINGFANALWTGLTTIEYAKQIEKLLEMKAHGLFQLVPENAISKYELLLMFEKYFPGGRTIARYENIPVDKSLAQTLNGYNLQIQDYETMISEMRSWIAIHRELYGNYVEGL